MRPRSEAMSEATCMSNATEIYRNYVRSYVQHILGIVLADKDVISVVVGVVKVTLVKFGFPKIRSIQ